MLTPAALPHSGAPARPTPVPPTPRLALNGVAFVDFFPRGPLDTPKRITSLAEARQCFGGPSPGYSGPLSLELFFANGGTAAWVVRIAVEARCARATLPDPVQAGLSWQVSAVTPGSVGNTLHVALTPSAQAGQFDLTVLERSAQRFAGPALAWFLPECDPREPERLQRRLLASHIPVSLLPTETAPSISLTPGQFVALTGGEDGKLPAALSGTSLPFPEGAASPWSGLAQIPPGEVDLLVAPFLAALPEEQAHPLHAQAALWAKESGALYLLDLPLALTAADEALAWWSRHPSLRSAHTVAAFPALRLPSGEKVGNSAAVAGIYVRLEEEQGVWKSPAGAGAAIRAAKACVALTPSEAELLLQAGTNPIKTSTPLPLSLWGARTTSAHGGATGPQRYVSILRLERMLQRSLQSGLAWTCFSANDEGLLPRVRRQIEAFLLELHRDGALVGETPEEAFTLSLPAVLPPGASELAGHLQVAPLRPKDFLTIPLAWPLRHDEA